MIGSVKSSTLSDPTAKASAFIELRQVVKTYTSQAGQVIALKGIDLSVNRGEFLVVTGKSGSGKTTLVNMLSGLDGLDTGEIWVDGTPLHRLDPEKTARWRGNHLGVVFQSFELLPTLTILQNVMLPMDFAARFNRRDQRARAFQLLEQVDIREHAHKVPSALSGGQQQRAAIARAMANDPDILVADEPTGSLDSATAETVVEVFETLVRQGRTVVLVTHDKDIARRGSRMIILSDGEIVESQSQADLND